MVMVEEEMNDQEMELLLMDVLTIELVTTTPLLPEMTDHVQLLKAVMNDALEIQGHLNQMINVVSVDEIILHV
jgi:hypothetical protein